MPNAFGPQTLIGQQTHAEKYRGEGETYEQAIDRVCDGLSDSPDHRAALHPILGEQRFMPAGRVQAAIGSKKSVCAHNCFVSGTIEDSFVTGDGNIMQRATEAATTMRAGGGIGYNFGTLRPRGALIRKLMSASSGPVSFMHIFNAICTSTSSAGNRRGAQMGVMPIWHPDIEEFIDSKKPPAGALIIEQRMEELKLRCLRSQDPALMEEYWKMFSALQATLQLTGFNISVGVTDEFMRCLKADGMFDLRFEGKVYRTVRAADLWEKIMRSTWDWAEPGVLFLDRINEDNNLWYCETIYATNPCFTGDTQVWTDQGRRSFRELAQTGASVRVLTQLDDGRLVYRTMKNPRKTQENASLVEVLLDNGTKVVCTPEHRFYLRDGRIVEAQWLKVRDSVCSVYRHKANSRGYKRLCNGLTNPLEHHVPFENVEGLGSLTHVHHKNKNRGDNRPENLELINGSEHNSMHMRGDDNPARRMPHRNPMKLYPGILAGKKNGKYRPEIRDEDIVRLREQDGKTWDQIAEILGCCKYTPWKRYRILKKNAAVNHKVVSVRTLEGQEDVYCGTVEETGRFFVATGPDDGVLVSNCAEQPLPPFGACLLGSFNLVKYLVATNSPVGYQFDMSQLIADIPHVVRAMDNVIDVAQYPLPEQRAEALAKRRMGLGVTGLANCLEILDHPYGSPDFLRAQRGILSMIAQVCYQASVNLAQEKGAFPALDVEKYLQSGFCKRVLSEDMKSQIRRHGIRNSHLLSIAPCGTISLAADNPSSGCEPVFSYTQDRDIIFNGGKVSARLEDWAYANCGVCGRKADEISADEHLAVLIEAQHWMDSAVSKTCNVSPSMPWDEFKDIYVRAWEGGCKGITTFNKGGKRAGILRDTDDQTASCTINPETGQKSCG